MSRINQSTIKRVAHLSACPARYNHENIIKDVDRNYSAPMLHGHFFEYKALGTLTKEGRIPFIPRLKTGKKSTGHIRIEEQAITFRRECQRLGIRIIRKDELLEYQLDNDITLFGTADILVEWNGRPYILDVKFTTNIESTFGDYAWGEFLESNADERGVIYPSGEESMDLLQPDLYRYILEQKTGVQWGFLYAVFDASPRMGKKFIEIVKNPEREEEALTRARDTVRKLKEFERLNYPYAPTYEECKSCKFLKCEKRIDFSKLVKENQQ